MGATTSKEPQPGGSESRGGVTLVNTNNSTAESEVDKYDATSTSKRLKATARGHPALSSIVFRVGMFLVRADFLCPIFLLVACATANASRSPPAYLRRQAAIDQRVVPTPGLAWGFHLHDTPFVEVRTYEFVRRGVVCCDDARRVMIDDARSVSLL